ncbi:glycosyltransferase [Algibacter pacificus]|uniref:glycosyltransferase n=1 Tax=Algibacter pacificus TaxID=2599389 RepID=UPI0011C8B412|nr:glycosyltransferase [Algibacter pacificus]
MTNGNIPHVCILVDCLTGGGAEKAASLLSKSFYETKKVKVSIVSMQGGIDYDFKGELYNLGGIKHNIPFFKTIKKLFQLKKVYKQINADFYLDFRVKNNVFRELIFHLFITDLKKTVLTIHSYRVYNYLPQHIIFYRLYNKAKAVVVVSKGIYFEVKKLYDFKNLIYIPNFYNKDIIVKSQQIKKTFDKPFIVAVGRLKNEVKQFDKLILAYKDTYAAKHKIPLYILGRGEDKKVLEHIILDHKLNDIVKLLGFKKNPYPYIAQSEFLILSSKIEGMPMVLVESLALGTPVVSFNCKTGPSEIINHNENGILVEDQDFIAFKNAMDIMCSNKELYVNCKANSKASVCKYSNDAVYNKWAKLLHIY